MIHCAKKAVILVLFSMLGLAGAAVAVSYPVVEDQREEKAAKGIREKGEAVCLFQSGTEDVRKTIGIGDLLIVSVKAGTMGTGRWGRSRSSRTRTRTTSRPR